MKEFYCAFELNIETGKLDIVKSEIILEQDFKVSSYPKVWAYLTDCECDDPNPVIPIDIYQKIDDDAVLSKVIYNARIMAWNRLKQLFLPMTKQYEEETGELFVS